MPVYEYRYAHILAHEWRTQDNAWGSVLSFHHVGPRNQIQVLSLGGRHFLTAKPSLRPENKQILKTLYIKRCYQGNEKIGT